MIDYYIYSPNQTGLLLYTDQSGVNWGLAVTYVNHGNNFKDVRVRVAKIGDHNFDGYVGYSDWNVVGANWGMTEFATWETGDFTGDGKVDGADLNAVGANWDPEPL